MKTLAYFLLLSLPAWAAPELSSRPEDMKTLREFLSLSDSYLKLDGKVRVAVLAAGFAGMEAPEEDRLFPLKYLPDNTVLVADYGPGSTGLRREDTTGRRVAQLAWALLDYPDQVEFRLYNGNGLSNQRRAVEEMMSWEPHVVLSTEVFPTFGNFDGTGPLNRYIRALSQMGTIWIQSAGTVGGRVYNGKVDFLPGQHRKHPLKVETDDTEIEITLSWNAFSPGRSFYGTRKDLDLVVYDSRNREVARSELRQVEEEPQPGETNLATEQVKVNLLAQTEPYQVCVYRAGGEFEPGDCYRLTLESEKQPYFDEERKEEVDPIQLTPSDMAGELGVPADNPFVITVGSDHPWSAKGPTWDGRDKPEVIFDRAEANFTDKSALVGPHVSVAYLGAMVISLKSNLAGLQEKHVRKFVDWGKTGTTSAGPTDKTSGRWTTPSLSRMRDLVRDNP